MTHQIDEHAARELELHAYNEYQLEMRRREILKNVQRKIDAGTYDPAKAPKLWMCWVTEAAQDYCYQHGGSVRNTFPKAVREHVANEVAVQEYEELLSNPLW